MMKKSNLISVFLGLSVLMAALPAKADDIEGFTSLVAGGIFGTSAVLVSATALAAALVWAKAGAKAEGVSVRVFLAAKNGYVVLNEQNKRILTLAQQKKKDELRKEIIELNKNIFGQNWKQDRSKYMNAFFGMKPFKFVKKYSSDMYNKVLEYIRIYVAVALLYLYDSTLTMMFNFSPSVDLIKKMDQQFGFIDQLYTFDARSI